MFRPIKIRHYLTYMKSRGHSPQAVLRGTGIDEDMLQSPDLLMDVHQSKIVVTNLIELSGNPGIGFEIGNQTRYMDLGMVGYLVMSARTVGEACNFWATYCNALVGMMIRLTVERHKDGDWSHGFYETAPLGVILNFYVEELMSMIYKLGGELALQPLKIRRIDLAYPPPPHHRLYGEQFNCPVSFNASTTRMVIESPHLDHPLHSSAEDFKALCAQQCELLIRQIDENGPVVARIKDFFMGSIGDFPDIETVARKLNVSARTLRRYLYDEGYSYRKIVSEYRSEKAKEYLRTTPMSTKEIAHLIGFQDTESLRRAFKSWTGMTIEDYRKRVRDAR